MATSWLFALSTIARGRALLAVSPPSETTIRFFLAAPLDESKIRPEFSRPRSEPHSRQQVTRIGFLHESRRGGLGVDQRPTGHASAGVNHKCHREPLRSSRQRPHLKVKHGFAVFLQQEALSR